MNETLSQQPEAPVTRDVRGHLAMVSSNVLWRMVGVAVGAIGYAVEAGFELEMRRVAMRSAVKSR